MDIEEIKKISEILKNNEIQTIKESDIVDSVIVIIKLLIPAEICNIRTIKRILSEAIDYFENCSLEQKG